MIACVFAFCASAIEYVFPPASGVFDVTKAPYNADRTGKTDVSAILSKAANDIINIPSWNPGIMYLPNGTYLVKNTIAWRLTMHGNGCGPHMIGQSRSGTVIKLAKGTWPLGTEGKGVIQTGAGDENNFNKGIMNLTVLVDSNNAGAIGIVYVSDNTGMMSDVDVISADGKGMYGIQSAGNFAGSTVGGNGPFIIRRTYIKGFAVGFRGCASEGEMMSQIRLSGQSKYGLWASCGDLIIDSLTANDTCIAVEAEAPVMLTNAVLTGGSPTAYGIRNFVTSSFFRDIKTTGYKFAISSVGIVRPPLVSSFDEYTPVPTASLFSTATKSMNIPARYPPEIPWESDFTKWAFPADYKTGGRTDAQALQAAIDDPAKTTVCLPEGAATLQIDQPVYVRGNISRIFGTGSGVHKASANAQIIIDNGSAPIVMIQKISHIDVGDGSLAIPLYVKTSRTCVFETVVGLDLHCQAAGETYVTDYCSNWICTENPGAKVWVWQWEGTHCGDSALVTRSGMIRAVGGYDECNGSMIFCLGGITEILGYWEYSTTCTRRSTEFIMTVAGNANASAEGVWQQNFCTPWGGYDQLVKETRGTTTKILYGSAGTGRVVNPGGGNIALYTAYDSAAIRDAMHTGAENFISSAAKPGMRVSAARGPAGIEVTYSRDATRPLTLLAYDLSGRIISIVKDHSPASGIRRALLPRFGGIVCIELRAAGESVRSLVVP